MSAAARRLAIVEDRSSAVHAGALDILLAEPLAVGAGQRDVRRTLGRREWLEPAMEPGATTYDLTGDGRVDANPP